MRIFHSKLPIGPSSLVIGCCLAMSGKSALFVQTVNAMGTALYNSGKRFLDLGIKLTRIALTSIAIRTLEKLDVQRY